MSLTKASYAMINGAPLNVLDFGAYNDATNPAATAAAIQAAIDACPESEGQVYFPPGTYYISTEINVKKRNISLVGDSNFMTAIVRVNASNPGGTAPAYSTCLLFPSDYPTSAGTGNITIEGLNFVCLLEPTNLTSGLIQISGTAPGVSGGPNQVTGIRFLNCRFAGGYCAFISFDSAVGGTASGDLQILNCGFDGISRMFNFTSLSRIVINSNTFYDVPNYFMTIGEKVDTIVFVGNYIAILKNPLMLFNNTSSACESVTFSDNLIGFSNTITDTSGAFTKPLAATTGAVIDFTCTGNVIAAGSTPFDRIFAGFNGTSSTKGFVVTGNAFKNLWSVQPYQFWYNDERISNNYGDGYYEVGGVYKWKVDQSNVSYYLPKRVSAASEPTLGSGEAVMWRNSGTNAVWLVFNDPDAGQKKVQLT